MVAPAPSKKTVADLKASILSPALTSHYECWFQPPSAVSEWLGQRKSAGLGNYTSRQDSLISLSCSEASLPGSSLATHEINNDFTGVTERHAYRRQYDDRASFTFYVDSNYEIIYFFENWIAYIVNEQRTDSVAFGPGMSKPNFSYRVNFPKDYQQTIYINKFEKDHSGRSLVYNFIQAYPISIDSMPVSYDASQLLKCTVSFTYSRYIIDSKIITLDSGIPLVNLSDLPNFPVGYTRAGSVDINNNQRQSEWITPSGRLVRVIEPVIR